MPTNADAPVYTRSPITSYVKRGVNPHRLQALKEHGGRTILDAGCGSGAYVFELAEQFNIIGVDYQRFEPWEQRPERFSVCDVRALPHAPGSVETIASFEVLEHIEEPRKVLEDFFRICSKNIIITVPNCDITPGMRQSQLVHFHWIDSTHVNFFTLETITALCKEVGFRKVTGTYINAMSFMPLAREAFDFSGLWGKVLSRALSRAKQRPYYLTCMVVAEK